MWSRNTTPSIECNSAIDTFERNAVLSSDLLLPDLLKPWIHSWRGMSCLTRDITDTKQNPRNPRVPFKGMSCPIMASYPEVIRKQSWPSRWKQFDRLFHWSSLLASVFFFFFVGFTPEIKNHGSLFVGVTQRARYPVVRSFFSGWRPCGDGLRRWHRSLLGMTGCLPFWHQLSLLTIMDSPDVAKWMLLMMGWGSWNNPLRGWPGGHCFWWSLLHCKMWSSPCLPLEWLRRFPRFGKSVYIYKYVV